MFQELLLLLILLSCWRNIKTLFFKYRSSLLDLGCGRGEMSSAFDQLGLSVTSCDKESVISRFFNNINFSKLILRRLHFYDNSFDVVFISLLLSISTNLSVWNELHVYQLS